MDIFHLNSSHLSYIEPKPCVMAIGYFDGIHLGHQQVLKKAISLAEECGLISAVMTFHPHPREVLGIDGYNRYITPLKKKLQLLKDMGIHRTYVVHFDLDFASISPEDFINDYINQLFVRHVVVGYDFTFGHKGQGTADSLKNGSQGKFSVHVIQPVNLMGDKVSSTLVREYLSKGEVEKIPRYLGRYYQLTGIVVEGEKRGRTIGFPTANLNLNENFIVPASGVYGVRVTLHGKSYNGVMNIGFKPTFHQRKLPLTIEVHIFDFAEQIYDEILEVDLLFFIRHEKKFCSVNELFSQIKKDIAFAKDKIKKQFR
ncbi:bifunctional riboflavin kinase/FAD synthetase [Microaerobacter geothermalis]|uniref:bifunctional riboflavin kinase/FAD synthetase n=1 Tax=Microaerobacter geothermalis TaxID=674972 RepID=UPI001F027D37|nr:bifunctional riboflavin kinase/FAD synthetase [Microaerobacter geothermalis]MCF6093186.1 bifunctional riboflavin kinase/FAD synthetase [Microaerobacter geothermalis]